MLNHQPDSPTDSRRARRAHLRAHLAIVRFLQAARATGADIAGDFRAGETQLCEELDRLHEADGLTRRRDIRRHTPGGAT